MAAELWPKIKQIDTGLGRYYALKDVNHYFDDDRIGKFAAFCKKNGIVFFFSYILCLLSTDCKKI